MRMPKTRKEFERLLINSYNRGMNDGYAVEHADIADEENEFRITFAKEKKFSKETIAELEQQHGK